MKLCKEISKYVKRLTIAVQLKTAINKKYINEHSRNHTYANSVFVGQSVIFGAETFEPRLRKVSLKHAITVFLMSKEKEKKENETQKLLNKKVIAFSILELNLNNVAMT